MESKNQEQAISPETMNRCIEFAKEDRWEDAINLFENDENSEHLYYKSLLTAMHFDKHRKEIPCFSWLQALDAVNKAINIKADSKYFFLKSIMCYNLSQFPGTLSPDKGGLVDRLLESFVNSTEKLTIKCHCSITDYDHIHPRNNCSTVSLSDSAANGSDAIIDTKQKSTIPKEDWQQQALDSIEIALQLDESNVEYSLLKVKILLSMGQLVSARELLNITQSNNPDRNDIILDLIDVLEKMDMGKEAICTISEALQNTPSDMILVEKKLRLLIKHEMYDELDAYLNILNQHTDLSFEVYLALIDASVALHDVISAIDILITAITVDFVPEMYFSRVTRACVENTLYIEAKKVIHLAKRNFYRYDYDQDYANDSLEELYYILYDYLIREKEYQEALNVAEMASADGLGRLAAERIRPLVYLGRLNDAITIIQRPDILDIEGIIADLWESAHYYEVHRLCEEICDQTGYLFDWYSLWACVALGLDTKASEYLSKLSFNGLFEQLSNPERKEKKNIKELFQMELPFHKMNKELFIAMLSMLFDGSKKLSDLERDYLSQQNSVSTKESNCDPVLKNDASYIDLKSRIALLKMYMHETVMFPSDFLHFVYELLFAAISSIQHVVNVRMEEVRTHERNRILSNLSHSIKNMLRSVIDPLINLKTEFPERANTIDNALKGANLIREMVNSINLSYETSVGDLLWDIKHPGSESMALQDMIISSLQYSIGNMFDFRYFPSYAENYYPRSLKKQDFAVVKEVWKSVSTTSSLSSLHGFAEKNMFKLKITLTDSAQYHIGNEKSSAIKLLILFQEIIFNAVKYASYVPRAERFIEIDLSEHDDKLKLQISNSFRPEVQAKTTGVGKLVIENFAKVLDCTPVITTDDNVYSITMEFHNIWRNNA